MDREKVIKGLEHCLSRYVDGLCDDCPYMGELDKSYMIPMKCKEIIMRDALELLKEQEAVEPIKPLDKDDDYTFMCSNCKGELFCGDVIRDNFCPTCGRSVKWE